MCSGRRDAPCACSIRQPPKAVSEGGHPLREAGRKLPGDADHCGDCHLGMTLRTDPRLFARHTPLAAHSPMCRPAGRPSGSSRPPPPDSVLWADRVGSRRPWATTRLPSCPMPIASDLHDALWATFGVQALPAGPQHRHPRARFPVPGCSEVSQPGLPSCLVGCTGNPR